MVNLHGHGLGVGIAVGLARSPTCTGTPVASACICVKKSERVAPPAMSSSAGGAPVAAERASRDAWVRVGLGLGLGLGLVCFVMRMFSSKIDLI